MSILVMDTLLCIFLIRLSSQPHMQGEQLVGSLLLVIGGFINSCYPNLSLQYVEIILLFVFVYSLWGLVSSPSTPGISISLFWHHSWDIDTTNSSLWWVCLLSYILTKVIFVQVIIITKHYNKLVMIVLFFHFILSSVISNWVSISSSQRRLPHGDFQTLLLFFSAKYSSGSVEEAASTINANS